MNRRTALGPLHVAGTVVASIAVMASALAGMQAAAAGDDAESAFRGRRIAEANCAGCHALAQFDESTLPAAPPLREIGRTISAKELRELLRGPVFERHAAMPDFEPDARQARDLAAYIADIARP